jgi:TatD DNase family protein
MWNGDDTIEVISIHDNQQKKYQYYTFGFHPWWTLEPLSSDALTKMSDNYLYDDQCLGLGEFGLDNLKGADLDIQEHIFIQQISIANQVKSPVVIHCVRSFDRVLRLRKKYGETPWVIHGFVRNKILARQVLDAGILLSVAPHSVMTNVFSEMLAYIPINSVFLETDSDFSMNIKDRYATFAALRQLDVKTLREQMFLNFTTFYKDKWKHHVG